MKPCPMCLLCSCRLPQFPDDSMLTRIKILQAMGIQRYIFFSIHNAEKHPEVPLMQVKTCTEKFLEQSSLNYTIFRLCGFMQARLGTWLSCKTTFSNQEGKMTYAGLEHAAVTLHGAPVMIIITLQPSALTALEQSVTSKIYKPRWHGERDHSSASTAAGFPTGH